MAQFDPDQNIEYNVLWIKEEVDPEAGVVYVENPSMLEKDYGDADSFLYDPKKFINPTDVFWAPDQSAYIFVVDKEKNKFYQFTTKGYEGVPPPANSTEEKILLFLLEAKEVDHLNLLNPVVSVISEEPFTLR